MSQAMPPRHQAIPAQRGGRNSATKGGISHVHLHDHQSLFRPPGIALHQAEEKVRSFLRFLLLPRAFVVEAPQRLTRPERHIRYTD
jgi:hypothetical protein